MKSEIQRNLFHNTNSWSKLQMNLSAVLFLSYLRVVIGVVIDCKYEKHGYSGNSNEHFLGSVYAAWLVIVSDKCDKSNEVVGVSNKNHMKGMTRIDVEMVLFEYQQLLQIPRGIEYFYPHLLALRLPFCQLESVSQDVLKYPKLKFLYLGHNKLKHLGKDLFINNPRLEFVGLESNSIVKIGSSIFDSLTHLKLVYSAFNKCIDSSAANKNEISKLIEKIKKHCA